MKVTHPETPIGIAAGLIKSHQHLPTGLLPLLHHVTFGSYTKEPRQGNSEPTYWFNPDTKTSINAVGLTNPGLDHFIAHELPKIYDAIHTDCELRVSLAPLMPGDIRSMLQKHGAHLGLMTNEIEINAACPNHRTDGGTLHPVLCCDPKALEELMAESVLYNYPKAIKIAPSMDVGALEAVVELALRYDFTSIVSGNTMKQSSVIDGVKRLSVDHGGLAGATLLAGGISQISTLSKILNCYDMDPNVRVRLIGCGGVMSSDDIQAYLKAGADAVQCATYFAEYGSKGLQDLITSFALAD
jgi:dihydroorotate dehydrogenase